MSASRGAAGRRQPRENTYLADIGKKGRKTGIILANQKRDEHGFENMEDLFSPEKAASVRKGRQPVNQFLNANATISESEDMEVGESTIPEPTEFLTTRKSAVSLPLPRSKSPLKTFLQSPARHTPRLAGIASPVRGHIKATPVSNKPKPSVKRRLDFSRSSLDSAQAASVKGSPSKAAVLPAVKSNSKLRHSLNRSPALFVSAGEDDEVQDLESNHNDSFQMQPFPDNDDARSLSRPHSDDEDIPAVVPVNKEKPAAKKTGMGKAPKRRREEEAETDEPPKKKGRPRKNDTQTDSKTASTSHKTTKEVKRTSLASDSSPVIVQRGPPRPKNNNGLYILRREGPEQGLAQTRAGRQVRKPLEYWKGDRMEIKYEPTAHDGKEKVYFPVVKSVMRAEQIAPTLKKPSRKHGAQMSKRSKSVEVEEEEDELEDWEAAGGSISLDIREWDPTDPTGIETADTYAEVALSSGAIVTKQIPGANFMFAKTLTLPFFGSGMVDLPPGSIKRPKNTRKMQMVFFVFVGRVNVMVNDSTFRIGKGGMFQVPRGNFYSIENDHDKPARIFFAQGCEVIGLEEWGQLAES